MNVLIEKMKESASELKDTKKLTTVAMLIALAVILGFFATIQLGDFLKIGFSFVPNELTAMLFGPTVGGIMAGISDILKFIVKPTGQFFPGFTISAILGGMIYGFVFYKQTMSLKRIVFAKLIVAIFVNTLLNTYWLSILLGKGFFVLISARVIKELIMFPIEVFVFYIVSKSIEKIIHNFHFKKV